MLATPAHYHSRATLLGQLFRDGVRNVCTAPHVRCDVLPIIRALWMLCSMPTRCHEWALQCPAKPTRVVPTGIFHATWLRCCFSKWPAMHLHISGMQLCGEKHGPIVGVRANHHVCVAPPTASTHATNMVQAMPLCLALGV